jgi:hypothetical protein
MPQRIHETAVLPAIDAEAAKSGRLLIEIISPGWGSSGHYSAKVLENAVAEKVWAKGTHVYLDHPTESETYSRPARTVKDLVAKLTEDAHLDEQGRVVAQIQVFKPYRPLLTDPDFAEAVGMSIRAAAEARMGEAEGRKGQIVTRLIPDRLNSVDVVTHAGRGGRILSVLESLRTPTDSDATEAAVSDQRAALADALNAAYGGEKSYVGIRDFDPEAGRVWFWYENPTGSGTYQVDYEADESGSVTLTGDPIEVRATTVYVPIATQPTEAASTNVPAPAGQHHPPTESKEDTMPEIEAGRLAQLEEAAGRVPTLTDERDQAVSRAEAAEAALRNHRNVDAARGILAEAIAASTTPVTFSALEQRGILAALPTTDAGDLDAAAFRSAAEAEVAAKAKAGGAGRVTGFGVTEDAGGKAVPTWDDIDSIYGRKEA